MIRTLTNDEVQQREQLHKQRILDFFKNRSPLNYGSVGWDGCGDRYYYHDGPQRKKVAIIGGYPSREGAPFDDPAWEVWSCNALYRLCADSNRRFRADRWWEMHPLSVPPQTEWELEMMAACPVPLYTLDHAPQLWSSIRFPIELLLKLPNAKDYFSCTFAYQIAFAVALGFEEIGIWGTDLVGGREFLIERPCVEYWVGYAQARGVTVSVGIESALCWYPFRYGYDYDDEKIFGEKQERELDGNTKYIEMVEKGQKVADDLRAQADRLESERLSITKLDGD